jgi:LytS/YehU family sensor histidine kinase
LDFQALRFGDRLRLETTIAHASLPVLVPVFCLQTLVENSVHHSVDQNPAGGRIDIATWVEDDTLHLRVRDDGGGAPRAAGSGQSIGLRSLRERLETLYRGAASIVVAGSDTAGFDVTVTIPVSHESMPSSNWRAPSDAAAI